MSRSGHALKHVTNDVTHYHHHHLQHQSTPMVFNKAIVVFSSRVTHSQLDVRGRLVFAIGTSIDEWITLLRGGGGNNGNNNGTSIWNDIDVRQREWRQVMTMEHSIAQAIGMHHIFGAPHIALRVDYASYLSSYRTMAPLFHSVIRFNPSLARVPIRICDEHNTLSCDTSLGIING
jgi:hypothetical protein